MSSFERPRFTPVIIGETLSEMNRGEVRLRVPLLEGVVQVGTFDWDDTGELTVVKKRRAITVWNTDQSPLQVDVIQGVMPSESNPSGTIRESVLSHPVPRITFHRTKDLLSNPCWCPGGEGVDIDSEAALIRFANILGAFASSKQGKEIRS